MCPLGKLAAAAPSRNAEKLQAGEVVAPLTRNVLGSKLEALQRVLGATARAPVSICAREQWMIYKLAFVSRCTVI